MDTGPKMHLGAAYYPEQWPEAMWNEDFQRMATMGFTAVRMAEFAWSILEPTEGIFSFALFDQVLNLAACHGIQVILGTPTATPPAWLTHRYPEVLNARRDGSVYGHGQRRHYNYNSQVYQKLCYRIVQQMVNHYGCHPAVIGWQIDNEINCEVNVFYSDADHLRFREWLRERYGDLDALNKAWGTVFWSQTYTDWEQVSLTRETVSNSPNPHQLLDEKRFISDSAIRFVELQARIIRQGSPGRFITTNGRFGHLDSHTMVERGLDWLSYDSYPNFAKINKDVWTLNLHDRAWSRFLSVVRDVSANFWVMEQQAGAGGWVNRMEAPSPKPGQLRLWTYQSVAHGADSVLYFRWRTATAGTEIYWHGLNDYGNSPNRRLAEAAQVAKEFHRIDQCIPGTRFWADVAILKDYDNEWDGEFDRWVGPLTEESEECWYRVLQLRHIPTNVTYLRPMTSMANLQDYKLVIYAHPAIMSHDVSQLLTEYVRQGGTLVVGCRSGYKDQAGQCYMKPLPGVLSDLCGTVVQDFTWIGGSESPANICWEGVSDLVVPTKGFNEVLTPVSSDVEVLARYVSGYYSGTPACVQRKVGKGTVYYLGSGFTDKTAEHLLSLTKTQSPKTNMLRIPPEVELAVRESTRDQRKFWFLLNYSSEPQVVDVLRPTRDLISNQDLHGDWQLEPFGVAILEEG